MPDARSIQFYEDNILNQFDNITYKWSMYMVRPDDINKYDSILEKGSDGVNRGSRFRVIAQSGVEPEINIQSVLHDMKLVFSKDGRGRESVANVFQIDFVEPMGATLYTRIFTAAQELGILNHLKATYLLELEFVGYDQNGNPIRNPVGPYYYSCVMTALTFNYNEGATQYRGDLMEVTHQPFQKLALNTRSEVKFTASTFGEFLDKLTEIANQNETKEVDASTTRLYPNEYSFGTEGKATDWREWQFGASSGGDKDLGNVSVTGAGSLTFDAPQGTSFSTFIEVALMQTDNFRKLPTAKGNFHKDTADDPGANAPTWAELSKWFAFDTDVEYLLYDKLARDYTKKFVYNIVDFITPELNHDTNQHERVLTSDLIQYDRIRNIVRNDLLKKRFDYTFTGLNTEVMNLDVFLNSTYYQIQALNQGSAMFRAQAFAGEGSKSEQLNLLKKTIQDLKAEISKLQSEKRAIAKELENPRDVNLDPPELAQIEKDNLARRAAIDEKIREKNEELDEYTTQVTALRPIAQAEERLRQGSDTISDKVYLTQSELIGQNRDARDTHPLTFAINQIESKATNGPEEGDTNGAMFLGAVEINLNSLSDLVQQQLQIRGDPYWLGRPKSRKQVLEGANYLEGGVCYFLNMNFPTYPEHETGLMNIPEANFGIVGVYRVIGVVANYQDGQFTMTLESFRDINTNVGKVWTFLTDGTIEEGENKVGEPFKPGDEQGEEGSEGEDKPVNPDSTLPGEVVDGDGTGTVTENQATVAGIRKLAIASDLKQILATAGARAGVNVDVRSGGQDASTGFTGSDRHNNGHAADVALRLADGTRLSTNNPDHLPIIQNFIKEAKAAGATGIGAGNGYMGDNTFHIDNASLYGQGSAGYWGGQEDGGTYRSRNAPQWLKDIFT